MNKYKLAMYQAVYHGDTFSHNTQRDIHVYAENQPEAARFFKSLRKKEAVHNVGDLRIKALRENIAYMEWLGKVEFDCHVTFVDDQGRNFTVTNTVETALSASLWMAEIIRTDTKAYERVVVSAGIKEVLTMI